MMLELQATPAEVMRAVEALQEFAPANGVPEKAVFGLALALEECASNIVNHALKRDERQTFHVILDQSGDQFLIELRDRGTAFDPTTAQRRTQRDGDDNTLGGWGLELVRHYIDDIRYARCEGENVLRLIKRLSSTDPRTNHSHQTEP